MAPQIAPAAAAYDALCCLGLGFGAGLCRLMLPCRRRSAVSFWGDALLVGLILLLAQSFAVRYAAAGQLRWYHLAAAALGAASAQWTLGRAAACVRSAAARVLCAPVRLLRRAIRRQRAAAALRKTVQRRKKAEAGGKKQLPNKRRVLYNSNML